MPGVHAETAGEGGGRGQAGYGQAGYGPPPGYQPIILPGESISKYQRQAQNAAPAAEAAAESPADISITSSFPDDEPIFAAAATEPLHEEHDSAPQADVYEEPSSAERARSAVVNAAPQIAEMCREAQPVFGRRRACWARAASSR